MFLDRPSIRDYYNLVLDKTRGEVFSQTDEYLLSVDIEDYAEYLFNKYSLSEIEFDNNREISIEKIRKDDALWVRIKLPVIEGNKIDEILNLSASTGSYYSSTKMEYSSDFVGGSYIITETPASEQGIEMTIKKIKQEVDWRNNDIKKHNEIFKKQIHDVINSRKTQIQNEEVILEQITKKISVPLKYKSTSTAQIQVPLIVKQKIRSIIPPKATSPVEPQLDQDKFNSILTLIDNCCLFFESTPLTFSKLEEEEDLRNVILSNLNGVFEGDAVGEVFSKLGKTDIYLKVSKGGIFIAECKYWKGPKTVQDTVSQILDYLTWRNSYGVLIFFSRNKDFTSVIESLSEMIKANPFYVKGVEKLGDTHFKAYYHLKEDDRKLIEMHFVAYNLYAEK